MKKLIIDEQGSIAVYMIITAAALLLFHAVLIDYIRIVAASKQSEIASRSAVRSILSAYDIELREYGLFGTGLSAADSEQLSADVILKIVETSQSSDEFAFLRIALDTQTVRFHSLSSLSEHRIMERQIVEEMKYKAPLELTRNLIDKFTSEAEPIRAAQQFQENAAAVDKLMEKREQALEHASSYSVKLNEQLQLSYKMQNAILQQLEAAFLDEEAEDIELSQSGVELWTQLTREADQTKSILASSIHNIIQWLNQAQTIDQEIYAELSTANGNIELAHLKASFAQISVLGDAFFISRKSQIAGVAADFEGYAEQISVYSPISQAIHPLYEANERYRSHAERWAAGIVKQEQERRNSHSRHEQRKNEERGKVTKQFERIKEELGVTDCMPDIERPLYGKLAGKEGLSNKYMAINTTNGFDIPIPSGNLDKSAEETGGSALGLLAGLTEALEKLTVELYVNEYALTHFNNRTSKSDTHTNSHPLSNQEAEYILYGYGTCFANQMAAYYELYLIRLGVRTVEVLTNPTKTIPGPPIVMLLSAMAVGTAKAYEDMRKLLNGEYVAFTSKFPAIKLNYKDYLRMLFFAHRHKSSKLSRMQALIELHTNKDLLTAASTVQVIFSTNLNLWFSPAMIQGLAAAGILGGVIEENDYVMKMSAVMSY